MKNVLLAIAALLCISLQSNGQAAPHNVRDSLLGVLAQTKDDSIRANIFMMLGDKYERSLPDSATYFYKAAEVIFRQRHDTVGVLRFIAGYSDVLEIQNKYKEALALDSQAVVLAKKINIPFRLAAAYNNIAKDYYYMTSYDTCADYFLKAAAIMEKLDDKKTRKDLAGLYANISGIFSETDQFQKSYTYGLKAIAISREVNSQGTLLRSLENTGSTLLRMKKIDSALLLFQQSKVIAIALGDQYGIEICSLNMADIALGMQQDAMLKQNAEAGLAAATALDDKDGISKAYGYLGDYYFNTKNYPQAKSYVQQTLQIMKANDITNHIADQYLLLSDIELAMGDMQSYHKDRAMADSMREAALSETLLKNTQELEARYSLDKKQLQIDNLDKQNAAQGEILHQRNTINWVLSGAVLAFILAGFFYYRSTQQKNKLKQQRITELEKEKQLLAATSVLQGQEEERKRLAKDLHDGLGGILSSVKYSFSNMKNNLIITPESAQAFDRSMVMLDKSISELRNIAHNMMPEALVNFGLDSALKDFCQGINQSGAIQLTYQSFDVTDDMVAKNKASIIYRIVQELVNNVLKHAAAKTALVQLIGKNNTLSITVEDDGKGFEPGALTGSNGIGYINLQNRVTYLGGTLDVQTAPGKGTSINIEIPNITA